MANGRFFPVCVFDDGSAMVLSLEPVTLERAERAIQWQKIGQGQWDDWRICHVESGRMVDTNGNAMNLHQSPYTVAAWTEFIERERLEVTSH